MDVATFQRLLAPEGQTVLEAATALAPNQSTLLSCQTRLRKQYPVDLVIAALDTLLLRRKAATKFSRADRMYFAREALEQSSSEVIASYRANRFADFKLVADLCCGAGGDAIGLSSVSNVIAVDNDDVRLAMAQENLKAYDRAERATFVLGDARTVSLPNVDAAFVDPDRRADGKRHIHIRDYVPSVEEVMRRFPSRFPIGIKVAPGVSWNELDHFDAEKEFISVDGELKECVLWFGSLKSTQRRATVLPSGDTLFANEVVDPSPPESPKRYLYEPDPAVIRAHLVADLAKKLDMTQIDDQICYLSSDRIFDQPFAKCFEILESMPFHARRIGERLRTMDTGNVSIAKRGSAVDVDELRRGWRLDGSISRILILTRVLDKPWAFVAMPLPDRKE